MAACPCNVIVSRPDSYYVVESKVGPTVFMAIIPQTLS